MNFISVNTGCSKEVIWNIKKQTQSLGEISPKILTPALGRQCVFQVLRFYSLVVNIHTLRFWLAVFQCDVSSADHLGWL